jgi:hypothetical protein
MTHLWFLHLLVLHDLLLWERDIHTDCLACPLHVRDMCNRRHQMGYRTTHGWALERRNIHGDESKLSRCTNSIVVLTQTLQYWWLCYIGYCLAMILSKISIGVFLLRVTVQKIHKWIIYAAMAITGFTGAVFFFVTVFQCTPISYFCRFFKIWALRQCANCAVTQGIETSQATAFPSMLSSPSLFFTAPVQSFQTSLSPYYQSF